MASMPRPMQEENRLGELPQPRLTFREKTVVIQLADWGLRKWRQTENRKKGG